MMSDQARASSDAISEELFEFIREEGGLTADALFESLTDAEREVLTSVRSVERLLAQHPDQVHRVGRAWHPGPAPHPSEIQEKATPPPTAPLQRLEWDLRQRLLGRRLIAEVGLDARLFEELSDAVEEHLRTKTLEQTVRLYPFTFLAFMVGHGVYNYAQGNFWGNLAVAGIDKTAGPIFLKTVRDLHLEPFDDLVEQDNASRFVTPMLAHGGIPKYCLDDFFNVVIKDMQRVGASADELLTSWRTRKSAFFQVDKPVGRFLLHGGDLAVDLLDRCIAAIEHIREHGRLPTPDEAGLPPYILVALDGHREDIRSSTPKLRRHKAMEQPVLVLDPFAPFGPEMQVPPVRSEMASTWRLWSANGVDELPASTFETRAITARPARSWTLQLTRHGDSDLEWSFEGFDDSPAIFFDTNTGALLPSGRSIRAGSVWVLSPAESSISALGTTGPTEARVVEECADLSGSWTGFSARRVDLADVQQLVVSHESRSVRRNVQPESAQPNLLDEPIRGVRSDSGMPVFPRVPRLQLPTIEGMPVGQWKVRLTEAGQVHHLVPDEDLVVDLLPLLGRSVVPSATLTARGPLGVDFKTQFVVAAGLTLTVPDRLILPGDRHAPITIGGPGLSVDGAPEGDLVELDATANRTECRVEGSDGALSLTVDLPRLVWAPVNVAAGSLEYTDHVLPLSTEEVADGTVQALAIRTGRFDLDVDLRLVIDGNEVQSSPPARTAGVEGRRVFGLAQFISTLRQHHGSIVDIVLRAGQRPVTVARLRPPVGASAISCVGRQIGDDMHVTVGFESDTEAKHRVARFWPLFRPWDPPTPIQIPDDANEVTALVSATDLPAGTYLLEIEVDDGWTTAARPPATAPNVCVVGLGDLDHRWPNPTNLPAIEILERILATGHIGRRLEPEELDEIAVAALESSIPYVVEPEPGLNPPRGAEVALRLLSSERSRLVRAVNDVSARLSLSPTARVRLAIELLDRLDEAEVATDLDDESMRMLWATAPVLAARLDLCASTDPQATSRVEEALEWTPNDGTDCLFAGEPVDQLLAGRPPELLATLRDAIDLMPKSILDRDTLVAANFEWLIAAKQEENEVKQIFRHWRFDQLLPENPTPEMERHLAQRQAPRGTETWASFPKHTLAAALSLIKTANRDARDFLWRAAEVAPKLVARDLVLAVVLNAISEKEAP